jgi:hypothetical protein
VNDRQQRSRQQQCHATIDGVCATHAKRAAGARSNSHERRRWLESRRHATPTPSAVDHTCCTIHTSSPASLSPPTAISVSRTEQQQLDFVRQLLLRFDEVIGNGGVTPRCLGISFRTALYKDASQSSSLVTIVVVTAPSIPLLSSCALHRHADAFALALGRSLAPPLKAAPPLHHTPSTLKHHPQSTQTYSHRFMYISESPSLSLCKRLARSTTKPNKHKKKKQPSQTTSNNSFSTKNNNSTLRI